MSDRFFHLAKLFYAGLALIAGVGMLVEVFADDVQERVDELGDRYADHDTRISALEVNGTLAETDDDAD